jgi:hypothetical protein
MKKLLLLSLFLSSFVNALELTNGQTITFSLNGQSLSSDIYIDIPANANTLKVEINNGVATSDFDLFMRYGSDFTGTDFQTLNAETDYSSGGPDADEFFTISTALNKPLKAGRWYIAVLNFNTTSENINLTATYNSAALSTPEIQFIFDQATIIGTTEPCDIAGWNDSTPVSPVSGNTGTTRGQQRKNAVLKAAELMTQNLQSTVPLIIQGCWPNDLEANANSAVLANAGARTFVNNTSGLIPNTWYPIALAERQSGNPGCKFIGGQCDAHSIIINFNPKIDTNVGLGLTRWYYGLNSTSTTNNPDFVSTALHEMAHGLGFSSAIYVGDEDSTQTCPGGVEVTHTNGTMLCNKIDIFSRFLVEHNQDDSLTALSEMATDALREQAMTNAGRLLWSSVDSAASSFNTLSHIRTGLIQLYAPSIIDPGSSVSHLSRAYSELMEPIQDENLRDLQLATPMLWDIGWDPRPKNSVSNTIPAGMYFDQAKNGHGFVIEPIGNDDLYFTVFYTYKDDGTPEWYTSLSTLENKILNVDLNTSDNNGGLVRFIHDFTIDPTGAGNPNIVDTSIGTSSLKIDFNNSATTTSSACNDGTSRGSNQAVANWSIGAQSGEWCIEPIANVIGNAPSDDFGAQWWAGIDDDGWGISLTFAGESASTVVVTLYYFDATGSPRWAQGVQTNFSVGSEITFDMLEFTGFARDAIPTAVTTVSAGSLSITINSKGGTLDDGRLTLDVNYQGTEGGDWSRSNLPITLITK